MSDRTVRNDPNLLLLAVAAVLCGVLWKGGWHGDALLGTGDGWFGVAVLLVAGLTTAAVRTERRLAVTFAVLAAGLALYGAAPIVRPAAGASPIPDLIAQFARLFTAFSLVVLAVERAPKRRTGAVLGIALSFEYAGAGAVAAGAYFGGVMGRAGVDLGPLMYVIAGLGGLAALAGLALEARKPQGPVLARNVFGSVGDTVVAAWRSRSCRLAAAGCLIAAGVVAAMFRSGGVDENNIGGSWLWVASVIGLIVGGVIADQRAGGRPSGYLSIAALILATSAPLLLAGGAAQGWGKDVFLPIGIGIALAALPAAWLGIVRQLPGKDETFGASLVALAAAIAAGPFAVGYVIGGLVSPLAGATSWTIAPALRGWVNINGQFQREHVLPFSINAGLVGDYSEQIFWGLIALTILGPVFMLRAAARTPSVAPPVEVRPEACGGCGAELRATARFCTRCGAPVPEAAPAAAEVSTASLPLAHPGMMLAASLLTAAAAGAAVLTVHSGVLDRGWGPSAVWGTPEDGSLAVKSCNDFVCVAHEMRARGATREQVEFAEAFSALSDPSLPNHFGHGFATKFHELGRVDVMEGETSLGPVTAIVVRRRLFRPMAREGSPGMPTGMSYEAITALLRADPETAKIWEAFPDADVSPFPVFLRGEPGSDGGQRLIFAPLVTGNPRALPGGATISDSIGNPEVAFDFDRNGEFVRAAVLHATSDADWRRSIRRRLGQVASPPPAPAQAAAARPSFDCGQARTNVERLICADPELARKDAAMASQYVEQLRLMRQPGGDPGAAERSQANQNRWRADRDRCSDLPCLHRAYDLRLSELDHWF